jgi:hypothetical protein
MIFAAIMARACSRSAKPARGGSPACPRLNLNSQPFRSGQKKIWIGFGKSHLIAGDDHNAIEIDSEPLQHWPCSLHAPAGRDCPGNLSAGHIRKQLASAREWLHVE